MYDVDNEPLNDYLQITEHSIIHCMECKIWEHKRLKTWVKGFLNSIHVDLDSQQSNLIQSRSKGEATETFASDAIAMGRKTISLLHCQVSLK